MRLCDSCTANPHARPGCDARNLNLQVRLMTCESPGATLRLTHCEFPCASGVRRKKSESPGATYYMCESRGGVPGTLQAGRSARAAEARASKLHSNPWGAVAAHVCVVLVVFLLATPAHSTRTRRGQWLRRASLLSLFFVFCYKVLTKSLQSPYKHGSKSTLLGCARI